MNSTDTNGGDGWTLHGLRRLLLTMLAERDARYEQRFEAQNEAIRKQDAATDRRFEHVNELRGALDDAAQRLMPRAEAHGRYDSIMAKVEDHLKQDAVSHSQINTRIDELAHRMDLREGEQQGKAHSERSGRDWAAIMVAAGAALVSVIALLYRGV